MRLLIEVIIGAGRSVFCEPPALIVFFFFAGSLYAHASSYERCEEFVS